MMGARNLCNCIPFQATFMPVMGKVSSKGGNSSESKIYHCAIGYFVYNVTQPCPSSGQPRQKNRQNSVTHSSQAKTCKEGAQKA